MTASVVSANEVLADCKVEYTVKLKLADQAVYGFLAMFPGHFGQYQLRRMTIVGAAKVGLYLEQLARLVEGHLQAGYRLKSAFSFFATGRFRKRT